MNAVTNMDINVIFLIVWSSLSVLMIVAYAVVRLTTPGYVTAGIARANDRASMWRVAILTPLVFTFFSGVVVFTSNIIINN